MCVLLLSVPTLSRVSAVGAVESAHEVFRTDATNQTFLLRSSHRYFPNHTHHYRHRYPSSGLGEAAPRDARLFSASTATGAFKVEEVSMFVCSILFVCLEECCIFGYCSCGCSPSRKRVRKR